MKVEVILTVETDQTIPEVTQSIQEAVREGIVHEDYRGREETDHYEIQSVRIVG